MKVLKFISVILFLLLLFSFAGCKDKDKNLSVTENTVSTEIATYNTTDSSPEVKQSFFSKIKENKIIFAIVIVLLLIVFIILIRFIICFFYNREPYPKGSVLKVNRGPYWHYGIYIGHNQVIHFAERDFNFGITADIMQTSLEVFKKYDYIEIEKELYFEYPTAVVCLTSCANRNITRDGTFKILKKDELCSIIEVSGHIKPRPKRKIVKLAKFYLGKKSGEYDLFDDNCEHFANWCRYGLFYSSQVEHPFKTVIDASIEKTFEKIGDFIDFWL